MKKSELVAHMGDVAASFVDVLDDAQRAMAVQPMDDDGRRDWHYIPRRRAGLSFVDMTAAQQKAAYDLTATGLSLPAYAAVTTIVGLEDALDLIEGGRGPRRMPPTGRWGRHRADYSTTVFGDPASDAAWGWRFEGHHVSLNVTIVDKEVAGTPLFLGSNPAEITTGSSTVVTRPLGGEEDLAVALFESLGRFDFETAWLPGDAPQDILTTNAPTLQGPLEPLGLRLAELRGESLELAERLVHLYLGRFPKDLAEQRWVELQPNFGDIAVAGAGEVGHRTPLYYRLQGPRFFVEYDNTQDDANHVHTVLRDPANDFGEDLLREHRRQHHRSA